MPEDESEVVERETRRFAYRADNGAFLLGHAQGGGSNPCSL
jgi:hypothetical protein